MVVKKRGFVELAFVNTVDFISSNYKAFFVRAAEDYHFCRKLWTGKPIVVHCAGGHRSAAASFLIHSQLSGKVCVFDLGEEIKQFQKK